MIITHYRTAKGDRRYVRALSDGRYFWAELEDFEVLDCAQGICTADELPEDVRLLADSAGYSYVSWPPHLAQSWAMWQYQPHASQPHLDRSRRCSFGAP